MNGELRPFAFAGLLLLAALGCVPGTAPNVQAGAGAAASPASGRIARLERLYAEDPGQLHVVYYLASAEAQAGRAEAALRWLQLLVEKGWDLGVLPLDLGALADDPRFASTLGRLRDLVRATSASEVAFRIHEKDLIPEGIAHDPGSGDFFVGSLRHHKILRVSPAGNPSTLVAAGAGGLGPVLGLEVDLARGWLWAVGGASEAGAAPAPGSPDSQQSRESAIFAFDLNGGTQVGRYTLGAGAEGAELNDLCVTKSGAVFATAGGTGAVVTLASGGSKLVELVPPGSLDSPNGIVCWPRGERLIVADSFGLAAVETATGSVRRLAAPAGTTVAGIDGLDLHGDTLIGVQNAFGLGRVIAVKLDREAGRILDVRPLETAHPAFAIPTTGAVVGDSFYYIANSHLDHLDPEGRLVRAEELTEPLILRLRLPE